MPLGCIGPHAGAGVLVEVKSFGADDFYCVSIDTVVEDVTDGGLGVGEETVTAGAQPVGVSLLCKQTTNTINKIDTNSESS